MAIVGLKVSEIELGKKLGFQAKLWPARNLCTIQLVILNSCLRGMSCHHSSSSSCCNSWGQSSCDGSHIRGSKGMSLISNRKSLSKRNFPSSRTLIDEQEP